MNPLTPARRSELRSQAHKLNPLVIIGDKGVTDEVVAEIDRTLKAHELIKVRAATDDREARRQWMKDICARLEAHPVQQIGKILVIYREKPEEEPAPRMVERASATRRRAGNTVSERGSQRQRARDAEERRQRDIAEMVRKGKIKEKERVATGSRLDDDARRDDPSTRPAPPRSRTHSAPPASPPRRRRPRSSR